MEKIDRFLAYLIADKGYSPATIRSYGDSLRDFLTFFQQLDASWTWTDVDADVIRRWVAHRRQKGIRPRTVHHELSALRSFYRYLMRLGEAQRNPATLVKNPKADKPLPAFLKEEEMNRLLDHTQFPDTLEGRRDRLILMIFYSTGIRKSELIGLNAEHINLDACELKVTGKRNKQRIIPFGKELQNALREYMAERFTSPPPHSGPLFPGKRKDRIEREQVNQTVHNYLSLVTTQPKRSPHVLRHTFATVMLNNGADLRAVKELLGHESLRTTEIYTHTSFAELKKEYEKAHPRSAGNGNKPDPASER